MTHTIDAAVPEVGLRTLELVGRSPAITRMQEFVRRASAIEGGVLMVAEAGADVESLARDLHARSRFGGGAFVAVACAVDEPTAIDRLLFGEPIEAAPTDLECVSRDSRLAAARGGTLFLQDIAELPAAVQARLARILRDGEVRIDGGAPLDLSLRLVASATPGIHADVDAHRFRADLYRRLSVTRIDVPSLRERRDDVPELAERVLAEVCAARGVSPRSFTQPALALIAALTWPGNLKQLQQAIERIVAETDDVVVQVEHVLPVLSLQRAPATFAPAGSLREARLRFEREYISAVLQYHGWQMAAAAQTLGMQRPNLYRKARQLGIPLTRGIE